MGKGVTRAFDVGVSSALLLITLPVFVLTGIVIWLERPGPIFERQRRVGNTGRPFALLRFRTLSIAPRPRVTGQEPVSYSRVGAVIHRLYLDELPQLLNILRGEMSFGGPRPSRAGLPEVTLVHASRERRLRQRRYQPDRRGTLRWHSYGGDRRYGVGRRRNDKWHTAKAMLLRVFPAVDGLVNKNP